MTTSEGRTGYPIEAGRLRGRNANLTPRELEVLGWLASGQPTDYKTLAKELRIGSTNTVKRHIQDIFGKLGVIDKTQALAVAFQRGLVMIGTPQDPNQHIS